VALQIQHFTATIAAGTPLTAPAVIAVSMPARIVRSIDWRVPTGPMGTFGWQIAMGGVKVFPTGGDLYVVADGQDGSWTLADAPDSGAWQVIGYNTGVNPHSVYLAFHVDLPERADAASAPLPAALLSSSPDLSRAGPPVRRRP
jgi:hypothetical protein